jgi:hypothetical protein
MRLSNGTLLGLNQFRRAGWSSTPAVCACGLGSAVGDVGAARPDHRDREDTLRVLGITISTTTEQVCGATGNLLW